MFDEKMNEKEGPLNPTYKVKLLNFVQKMKRHKCGKHVEHIFVKCDTFPDTTYLKIFSK